MMDKLDIVKTNLHNLFWFRLSRYFDRHYFNYTVNSTVIKLYNVQTKLEKSTKDSIKELARDMFNAGGFAKFCPVMEELSNSTIDYVTLMIIIYLCLQICRLYVANEEPFAVKYFIIELQKNLDNIITNKQCEVL